MQRLFKQVVLSILVTIPATALAEVVVLDFEGLRPREQVNNFYNGGTGSKGSSRGYNYGITFSQAQANIRGSGGNSTNHPTPKTEIIFLGNARAAVMNVPKGFEDGFSFYYSGNLPGYVTVYSGLNGTGKVLQTLNLPVQSRNGAACRATTGYTYCQWTPIGVKFNGIARSVHFGGSANRIGFDNITLGQDKPLAGATRKVTPAKPKPKPTPVTPLKPKPEPKPTKPEPKPPKAEPKPPKAEPKPKIEMGLESNTPELPPTPEAAHSIPESPEKPEPTMPDLGKPDLEI